MKKYVQSNYKNCLLKSRHILFNSLCHFPNTQNCPRYMVGIQLIKINEWIRNLRESSTGLPVKLGSLTGLLLFLIKELNHSDERSGTISIALKRKTTRQPCCKPQRLPGGGRWKRENEKAMIWRLGMEVQQATMRQKGGGLRERMKSPKYEKKLT